MRIEIVRDICGPTATHGVMYVNGLYFCLTLEDTDRKMEAGGKKVAGLTCIPRGEYDCIVDWSNRFKQEMPRLLNVPGFEGIRIHPGNTAEDTEGCILVGSVRSGDSILNSRATYTRLMNAMETALERGEKILVTVK